MKTYTKPPLEIAQLYDKLIDRQLVVAQQDKGIVFNAILRIGYYRLSGYCLPFLQTTADERKVFIAGTTIHPILALYEFDTALRSVVLQILAQVEIALATSICNKLCMSHHALWYDEAGIFSDKAKFLKTRLEAAKHLKFDLNGYKGSPNNPNLFLKHYYKTYSSPKLPPAWMLRECASFGFWSHTYEALVSAEKGEISQLWQYPNRKPIYAPVFQSWLHSLSVFRNRCAHHNRITNTALPYDPKTPDNAPAAARFKPGRTNDLRTFLLVIDILMRNVVPNSNWKDKLRAHFEEAAKKNVAVGKATGFISAWERDDFWLDWTPPAKASPAALMNKVS